MWSIINVTLRLLDRMHHNNQQEPCRVIQMITRYPFGKSNNLPNSETTYVKLNRRFESVDGSELKSKIEYHSKLKHPSLITIVKAYQSKQACFFDIFFEYVPFGFSQAALKMNRKQLFDFKSSLINLSLYLVSMNVYPNVAEQLIGVDAKGCPKLYLDIDFHTLKPYVNKSELIKAKQIEISQLFGAYDRQLTARQQIMSTCIPTVRYSVEQQKQPYYSYTSRSQEPFIRISYVSPPRQQPIDKALNQGVIYSNIERRSFPQRNEAVSGPFMSQIIYGHPVQQPIHYQPQHPRAISLMPTVSRHTVRSPEPTTVSRLQYSQPIIVQKQVDETPVKTILPQRGSIKQAHEEEILQSHPGSSQRSKQSSNRPKKETSKQTTKQPSKQPSTKQPSKQPSTKQTKPTSQQPQQSPHQSVNQSASQDAKTSSQPSSVSRQDSIKEESQRREINTIYAQTVKPSLEPQNLEQQMMLINSIHSQKGSSNKASINQKLEVEPDKQPQQHSRQSSKSPPIVINIIAPNEHGNKLVDFARSITQHSLDTYYAQLGQKYQMPRIHISDLRQTTQSPPKSTQVQNVKLHESVGMKTGKAILNRKNQMDEVEENSSRGHQPSETGNAFRKKINKLSRIPDEPEYRHQENVRTRLYKLAQNYEDNNEYEPQPSQAQGSPEIDFAAFNIVDEDNPLAQEFNNLFQNDYQQNEQQEYQEQKANQIEYEQEYAQDEYQEGDGVYEVEQYRVEQTYQKNQKKTGPYKQSNSTSEGEAQIEQPARFVKNDQINQRVLAALKKSEAMLEYFNKFKTKKDHDF